MDGSTPLDELAGFLSGNAASAASPQNPLSQNADPSANPSNPNMNPANPTAWANPSNPSLNPNLPGAVTNPSNPQYNPDLPGSINNPSNYQYNPQMPGSMTNPASPQLNPAYPGSLMNPANPIHNPGYPVHQEYPRPPGLSENASLPPAHAAIASPPTIQEHDMNGWGSGFFGRRPVIYDPQSNVIHIGENESSHGEVIQSAFPDVPEGHYPDTLWQGWIGHNPEAGYNDPVFRRGQPSEVGWYLDWGPPSVDKQTKIPYVVHKTLDQYAQQHPVENEDDYLPRDASWHEAGVDYRHLVGSYPIVMHPTQGPVLGDMFGGHRGILSKGTGWGVDPPMGLLSASQGVARWYNHMPDERGQRLLEQMTGRQWQHDTPTMAHTGTSWHEAGAFHQWQPGEFGKGFVTPMGNVVHWRTDGPDGYPTHFHGLAHTGYGSPHYMIHNAPEAHDFFEVDPTGYVVPSGLQTPEGYQKIVESHPAFTAQAPESIDPMRRSIRNLMGQHPEWDWDDYLKMYPNDTQYLGRIASWPMSEPEDRPVVFHPVHGPVIGQPSGTHAEILAQGRGWGNDPTMGRLYPRQGVAEWYNRQPDARGMRLLNQATGREWEHNEPYGQVWTQVPPTLASVKTAVDPNCPYCHGTGVTHDTVDGTRVGPDKYCDCTGIVTPYMDLREKYRPNPMSEVGVSRRQQIFGPVDIPRGPYSDMRQQPAWRLADNYTQDTREWPDPTEPRASEPPVPRGCTCRNGTDSAAKLHCPIHGLNGQLEDAMMEWSLPEGSPVGYPQDQPRGWVDAVHSSVPRLPIKKPPVKHNKFVTTREQHEKAKRIWRWFKPRQSAISPEKLAEWAQGDLNGPYLYHATTPDAAQAILKEGLYPHDQLPDEFDEPYAKCPNCGYTQQDDYEGASIGTPCPACHDDYLKPGGTSSYAGDFYEPRPGHTYMGKFGLVKANYFNPREHRLLRIDTRKLDPAKINPDEDAFDQLYQREMYPAVYKYSVDPDYDPIPNAYDYVGGGMTLGHWADMARLGDDPKETHHSLFNHGSIAYNGIVPPEAIELAHPNTGMKWEPHVSPWEQAA